MMKGISPVVAVVLLIAIAVIAAVAVWYWVAPLTGKPATIDYTQQKFAVVNCYTSSGALDIRSESGFTLNDLNFSVINAATGATLCDGAYLITSILPSETQQVANSTACPVVTSTQYTLRSKQGIPDVGFTCK
jgi:flagellin-like protein